MSIFCTSRCVLLPFFAAERHARPAAATRASLFYRALEHHGGALKRLLVLLTCSRAVF